MHHVLRISFSWMNSWCKKKVFFILWFFLLFFLLLIILLVSMISGKRLLIWVIIRFLYLLIYSLDIQVIMSYLSKSLLNLIRILKPRQSRQHYLFLFWSDIQLLIFELTIKLYFLLLSYIVRLYIIGDGHTVHGDPAEWLTNVINSHNLLSLLIQIKFAEIPEYIRIAVRSKMREENNVVIVLEFVAER